MERTAEPSQHEEGEIGGRFKFECKLTTVPGVSAWFEVIELCAFYRSGGGGRWAAALGTPHTRRAFNYSVGGDCRVIESAGDCTSKLCRNIGSSDATEWNVFDEWYYINWSVL